MSERQAHDRKLSAARVLGLTGGVIGLLAWFVALMTVTVGGLWAQLRGGDLLVVSGALLAALVFSVLGIVGGVISRDRPKRASTYLAVAGVGSLMVLSSLWLFFGPLLVAGAVLAWLGRPMEPAEEHT